MCSIQSTSFFPTFLSLVFSYWVWFYRLYYDKCSGQKLKAISTLKFRDTIFVQITSEDLMICIISSVTEVNFERFYFFRMSTQCEVFNVEFTVKGSRLYSTTVLRIKTTTHFEIDIILFYTVKEIYLSLTLSFWRFQNNFVEIHKQRVCSEWVYLIDV